MEFVLPGKSSPFSEPGTRLVGMGEAGGGMFEFAINLYMKYC